MRGIGVGREWRSGDPNGLRACPMIHVVSQITSAATTTAAR